MQCAKLDVQMSHPQWQRLTLWLMPIKFTSSCLPIVANISASAPTKAMSHTYLYTWVWAYGAHACESLRNNTRYGRKQASASYVLLIITLDPVRD